MFQIFYMCSRVERNIHTDLEVECDLIMTEHSFLGEIQVIFIIVLILN